MTTAAEATDKDFERMMQMLTGFFVTQIAGAVAAYSIADHLAKGPATAEQISTIVLDLPDVVPNATAAAAALGLAERSRAMAGDFFTAVPEADIYLLKNVLHDWNDEEAVRILKRCRQAMRRGGPVVVIETLLGEMGDPGIAPLMDLNLMVLLTGREGTLAEFSSLLQDAGLRFSKRTPIRPSPMAVIEAVAA